MIGFLLGLGLCGQCPIPPRSTGLLWGNKSALVSIEMFGDPLCPVCMDIWPQVSQVIEYYQNKISFRLHLLPLPYHTWAFVITRVADAIKSIDEEKAKSMLDALYKGDQDLFSNSKLADKGETENVQTIIRWAAEKLEMDEAAIQEAYKKVDINMAARIQYKYAGVHRVAGTPTIFVNGVDAPLYSDTPFEEWKSYIDNLLQE